MSRSLKKGPFISHNVLKSIERMNLQKKRSVIMTWSRSSTILPLMVGHTIYVHNGREHIPVLISDQMIGHRLGEFSLTRSFKGHIRSDKKTRR